MTSLAEVLQTLFFASLSSFAVVWLGIRRGFFYFPVQPPKPSDPPALLVVLLVFGIYLIEGSFLPKFLQPFLMQEMIVKENFVRGISWITFLTSLIVLISLFFLLRFLPYSVRQGIWRRHTETSVKKDAIFAIFSWLIAFPLTLLCNSLLEILLYWIYGILEYPDQVAIAFLKMTFSSPILFFLASVSIVVFAPLIEELMFRGFLQSYLRRYISPWSAIIVTSFCFAFFHYSSEQKLGNVIILSSLFLLSCFLGFLYERQGSLRAPLFLHAIFNSLSITSLYFLGI